MKHDLINKVELHTLTFHALSPLNISGNDMVHHNLELEALFPYVHIVVCITDDALSGKHLVTATPVASSAGRHSTTSADSDHTFFCRLFSVDEALSMFYPWVSFPCV